MLNVGQDFLTDSSFIPHGHCYLWKPSLVWLNIISDSLITLVYYSIPIALVYFVHKRKDFPFKWILLLFGAFIVSCGTTHLMDVWTLWHPTYWLSTFIKFITAIISLYTAIALLPIIPQALALPIGMSISYQIINKHGGILKCISTPLQGTEFTIQIPIQIKSV